MICVLAALTGLAGFAMADEKDHGHDRDSREPSSPGAAPASQLGPRPLFLVDDMADSPLKRRLASCENRTMRRNDF